ncbi:hypothetical protein Tco_0092440 [Tanacetum coccineum]
MDSKAEAKIKATYGFKLQLKSGQNYVKEIMDGIPGIYRLSIRISELVAAYFLCFCLAEANWKVLGQRSDFDIPVVFSLVLYYCARNKVVADGFSCELPRHFPPVIEIDFGIELIPGADPNSKAPYRMSLCFELKELKEHSGDLGEWLY